MALSTLYNRAKMTVSGTPGTGTITLGSAVSGYQSFASAGVPNSGVVSYLIVDGTNWEVGNGTYTTSGTTLARTTVLASNNSGSAISATSNAIVSLTALVTDLPVKKAPTFTVLTSGTNATYSSPSGCTWIRGQMIGGGGGGGGAGNSTAATAGGTTYFNTSSPASTSPLYAAGGGGGANYLTAGSGGTASGSGSVIVATSGSPGNNSGYSLSSQAQCLGAPGGDTFLGGAGAGVSLGNGANAAANTGSGGAGGAASSAGTASCGSGGGAGAYIEFVITSPASTYYYTIGSGGAGASYGVGSGVYNGGNGAAGIIIIEEHYNW